MEHYNFEEHLKSKLEERTIQPSVNAWSKLEHKLDAQERKNNPKLVWWLGIAASIVGVLLVAFFYFNNIDSTEILPELVETPGEETNTKEENIRELNTIVESEKPNKEIINTIENQPKTHVAKQNIGTKTTINKSTSLILNNEVVETNLIKSESPNNINIINEKSIQLPSNSKTSVAQASEKITNQKIDIHSEIDLLLNNAQKDVALLDIQNKDKIVVDANSLLEEVEMDLEESFRDKIFQTIKSGYKTVKTAVAERNN
jgi:hypothetical protein